MKPLTYSLPLTLLVMLLATNFIVIASASAATVPSTPEFTVKYVDASYDVPTTHSIDPYTGSDVTHQGYHVLNRTIQVSIKNVPFTPYESDGQIINYYLNIRIKGSYDNDWLTVYSPDNEYVKRSNSSTTTIVFSLDDDCFPFWDNIPGGGTVDFQVQALVGSVHRIQNASAPNILTMYPWVFDGQTGDWSSTQTVSIPSDITNSAGSFQVNNLVVIVVGTIAAIIAAFIAVAAVLIKRAKTQTATPTR